MYVWVCMCHYTHVEVRGGVSSLCPSCGLWQLDSSVRLGDKCLHPLSRLLDPSSRDSGLVAFEHLTHQLSDLLLILQLL